MTEFPYAWITDWLLLYLKGERLTAWVTSLLSEDWSTDLPTDRMTDRLSVCLFVCLKKVVVWQGKGDLLHLNHRLKKWRMRNKWSERLTVRLTFCLSVCLSVCLYLCLSKEGNRVTEEFTQLSDWRSEGCVKGDLKSWLWDWLSVCLSDGLRSVCYTCKDHPPQHAQRENTIKNEKRGIRYVLIGCAKSYKELFLNRLALSCDKWPLKKTDWMPLLGILRLQNVIVQASDLTRIALKLLLYF